MSISNRSMFGPAHSGFTLVELVMFIVIVGIAVVGVLQVLSATTKSSGDPQLRKQALSIAEALLEEVELARFTYCYPSDLNATTASGTVGCTTGMAQDVGFGQSKSPPDTRPYFNVNDYVTAALGYGVAQTAFNVGGILTDAAGNTMVATGNYTATLTITPAALGGIASNATPATTNVLLITVVVSYGNGKSVRLDGYRTRYAPQSIP